MKKLNYSIDNIDGLIKELTKYKDEIISKVDIFVRRLAEVGIPIIEQNIDAPGDSDPEHYTYIQIRRFGDYAEADLILEGRDILFIEFGAGVHFNGNAGSSPNPTSFKKGQGWEYRHKGGAELGYTIGGYGNHKGLQDSWFYRDELGDKQRSFGTKATMPMYKASMEIITNIRRIAKEVFG